MKIGEAIALSADTTHALGAGTMLIEVRSTSNTAYRLYDYDRVDDEDPKGALHIGEVPRNVTLEPHRLDARHLPLGMPHFVCREATAKPGLSQTITTDGASCAILVGIPRTLALCDGESEAWQLVPHEALLIPAETLPLSVAPGDGKALMITLAPAEL